MSEPKRSREWSSTPATRRRILDAALRCFDDSGVQATTIEDICTAAGTSVGSIYHHFGSKEDLFDHLAREGLTEYRDVLVAALEGGDDLPSSLRGLVRAHLDWVQDRPALTKLMLRWEEAERERSAGREHYQEYSDALGGWLREQAQEKRIRRLAPDLYSTLLLGPLVEHARQHSAGLITTPRNVLEDGLVEGLIRVMAP